MFKKYECPETDIVLLSMQQILQNEGKTNKQDTTGEFDGQDSDVNTITFDDEIESATKTSLWD